MAEIVNLRAARKAKARTAAEAHAATNRALHGRTAAEKKRDRDEAASLASIVDGAKLDKTCADQRLSAPRSLPGNEPAK